MKSAKHVLLFLGLTLFSSTVISLVAHSGSSRGGDATSATKLDEDLRQTFKSYETIELSSIEAARQVAETGELRLATAGGYLDLVLTPHDMRAANYRTEETIENNLTRRALDRGPVRTFKGSVRGIRGSEARFTIDENHVEGLILTPNDQYYVETAKSYSEAAGKHDYLLYKASDVISGAAVKCGMVEMSENLSAVFRQASEKKWPAAAPQAATFREAEIATEADYEYVIAAGGSTRANEEILEIMNQVEGVYERDLGISFKITYQHTWATPEDPYQALTTEATLDEFINHWNANFANIERDLAHMWTGKRLNLAGFADIAVVCRKPQFSYGVTQRVPAPFKYSLPAHEIGHNFGADHPTDPECANTIMSASIGTSLRFCRVSQNEIAAHINAFPSCLAVVDSNLAPTVEITRPSDNSPFSPGAIITLEASASDPDGRIAKVEFFSDTFKLGEDSSAPYSLTANTSGIPPGTYPVQAVATDNQGRTTRSKTVFVIINGSPNNPPVIAITRPADRSSFVRGTVISIEAQASDPDGSIIRVEFFSGSLKLSETSREPFMFTSDTVNVPPGTYPVHAVATDNFGARTTSNAIFITIQ